MRGIKAVIGGCLVALFGHVVVSTASAAAIWVESTTNVNQTVGRAFDDWGFEYDAVGSPPSASKASPSGVSYINSIPTGGSLNVVTGAQVNGPDGAFSGNNYLTLMRTASVTQIRSVLNRNIAPATDKFKFSIAVWIGEYDSVTPTSSPYVIMGLTPAGQNTPVVGAQIAGFGLRYVTAAGPNQGKAELMRITSSGSTASVALDAFNPGEWNTLEYTFDQSQLAGQRGVLTVNGTNSYFLQTDSATNLVGQIVIRSNAFDANDFTKTAIYLDTVPEPASAGVLIGAAMLLMSRRRKPTR